LGAFLIGGFYRMAGNGEADLKTGTNDE